MRSLIRQQASDRISHFVIIVTMSLLFVIGDPKTHGMDQSESDIPTPAKSQFRNRMLLFSERLSDVKFLVGPDDDTAVSIPVHTFMLRMADNSLANMFNGDWKDEKVIRIKDCDATTMYSLLRFIYCDEIVFEAGKLYDVLRIADKYLVDSLFEVVGQNCGSEAAKPFLWTIMSFAADFHNGSLIEKCMSVIRGTGSFIRSEDSLQASESVVRLIVSDPDLKVDEFVLLKWCMQWAEKEMERRGLDPGTSKRQVMDSFINEFAFHKMTLSDFAVISHSSDILTAAEVIEVFEAMGGIGTASIKFRKVARKGLAQAQIPFTANDRLKIRTQMARLYRHDHRN